MASIHKRTVDSGVRWEVRWRDADTRERSKSFRRRDAAARFCNEIDAERYGGPAVTEPERMTITAWSAKWLEAERPRLAPDTIYGYEMLLKHWILPGLGDRSLGRITPTMLRDWMTGITKAGCSPARAGHARRALHRMLEVAVTAELIPRNPCTRAVVTPTVHEREVQPLTPRQLVDLADVMGGPWRALVLLAGTGGPRRAELGALRRSDVSRDGTTVTVTATMHRGSERRPPKTRAGRRTVSVPPVAAAALVEHLAHHTEHRADALLWPSMVTSGSAFGRHWRAARRAIGRDDLHFHDLRHTAITLAIAGGGDAKVIQNMAGHASLRMTLGRYGHLLPSSSERVAEAVGRMFDDEG